MSKGKSTTTTTVPGYQKQAFQDLYAKGRQVANIPFESYKGQMVADQSANTKAASAGNRQLFNQANRFDPTAGLMGMVGAGANVRDVGFNPMLGRAQDASASQVNRGSIRDLDRGEILGKIGNYLNPYQNIVTDQGVRDLNRARLMQLQSDQDAQIGSGAFGGSRGALLEAETNKNFQEQVSDFVAEQNQRGFDTAAQLATSDAQRALQADTAMLDADRAVSMANQAALNQFALANQNLGQNYFNKLADLQFGTAQMDQQSALDQARLDDAALDRSRALYGDILGAQQTGLQGLQQSGLLDQNYAQSILDAQRSEFDRRLKTPYDQLGALASAVSGVPMLGGQTSQKKTGLGDVLGAGLQVASLFSDERLKTNITYLYTQKDGHEIYQWDWNDKAKDIGITEDYPTIGVIAQRAEVINPDAVFQDKDTGYLCVNYERL